MIGERKPHPSEHRKRDGLQPFDDFDAVRDRLTVDGDGVV